MRTLLKPASRAPSWRCQPKDPPNPPAECFVFLILPFNKLLAVSQNMLAGISGAKFKPWCTHINISGFICKWNVMQWQTPVQPDTIHHEKKKRLFGVLNYLVKPTEFNKLLKDQRTALLRMINEPTYGCAVTWYSCNWKSRLSSFSCLLYFCRGRTVVGAQQSSSD